MIIEIKGLPDGHKIKHINVDITFADGSCVVKTHAEPSHVQNVEHIVQNVAQHQEAVQDLHKDDVQREVIAAPNNNIDTRPKKEIPPEMVDIEF
jgi:hypothetical protein